MYYHELTLQFKAFLAERPAISPDKLAAELGCNRTNLQKIIIGKRNIPSARRGDFLRIMLKYGFTEVADKEEAPHEFTTPE